MKRNRRTRTGATAVEFALVAPLFFLILFALFEFSRINVMRHTADNAAYEAARQGIVPGVTGAQITAEAQRILSSVGARGATITVDPPNPGPATRQLTVAISLPMDQNSFVLSRFTRTAVLETSVTLRTERARTR